MNMKMIALLGVAVSGVSLAGEPTKIIVPEPEPDWEWCSLYEKMGEPVYNNKENPLFQRLTFSGRAHLQYAYVDGEGVDGVGFSEDFEELRRLRLGAELKMLKYFKLKGELNLVDDRKPRGGGRHLGYQNFDALFVSFNARKAFDIEYFDKVEIAYGRQKFALGQEVHTSSRKTKTVERSAVSNKVYPSRATGLSVTLEKCDWTGAAGVFSTDFSNDLGSWDAGTGYYLSSTFERENGDDIVLDFLYNDANGSLDNELTNHQNGALYEWAVSASYARKWDRLKVVVNATCGDNGSQMDPTRGGNFYGFVVLPTYWLVEDKWEAVARYTYQGSEEANGIRTNSRYSRRNHGGEDNINKGRGDEHHSIYAGINYYLCGEKSKIMTGIEYETLDTSSGDVDASTLWLAYRTYF